MKTIFMTIDTPKVAILFGVLTFLSSCSREDSNPVPSEQTVVVYTALDRGFSEPILDDFSRKTGIRVLAQYDTESTKSVGLANRIREERRRVRCDVFWNNEILNTLELKKEGLLQPSRPPEAENYAEAWRDPEGYWYGFAARARILIVNTELVTDQAFPRGIRDLADSRYRGRTAIAKPLFGTTASHIACLASMWGVDQAAEFLATLKKNDIQVQGGNKGCAVAVAKGAAAFALTDTDDAIIELEAGKPVRIVYPDNGPDGLGTLFLPNTLSVIRGAPHPVEAEALVNYLLSAEVEERLASGPSAQIPLHRRAKSNPRVKTPAEVKSMAVDFNRAATMFERREVFGKQLCE